MISPLRLAGSRLTSTTAGRAIATNSVSNARALQEEEHEAMRQHLEAMGNQHLEYRQPMLFRSTPINTQRVLQQDSQSDFNFQSIRSFSTSQCHQASMTSHSVMSEEADEDIHKLHREAMDQRSHQVSALNKIKGSLITKQKQLQRQTPQSQLDSQFQSVRSLHTNIRRDLHQNSQSGLNHQSIRSISTSQYNPASMTSHSLMSEEADEDIHRLHREAMDQRSHQVSALQNIKGSLIIKQKPLQRQTPQSQLDSQFQSVRSLHTNVRITDFVAEVPEEHDIMGLHTEAIKQRQQQMQELSQIRGSLITHKTDATRVTNNE